MASRAELHERLINLVSEILPINVAAARVKFQPSTNTKLTYPCVLYRTSSIDVKKADNQNYLKKTCYTLTVIDRDPDSPIRDLFIDFPYCRMSTPFVSDNLYHFPFTLYW